MREKLLKNICHEGSLMTMFIKDSFGRKGSLAHPWAEQKANTQENQTSPERAMLQNGLLEYKNETIKTRSGTRTLRRTILLISMRNMPWR